MSNKIAIISIIVCLVVEIVGSEGPGDSCLVENHVLALPSYCRNYLECIDGVYVIKTCKDHLVFDEDMKECLSANRDSKKCFQRCDFTQKIPVVGSDTKYQYCDNGRIMYGDCHQVFDSLLKECTAKIDSIDVRHFEIEENWFGYSSDCQPGTKSPVQGSCSNYIECDSSSVWVSKECPRFHNFQPGSLNCVRSSEYNCVEGRTSSGPTSYPTVTEYPTYTTSQTSISSTYDPSTVIISTHSPTEQSTMISTFEPSTTMQDFSTTFEPTTVTTWTDEPTTDESTSVTSSSGVASSFPSPTDDPSSSPPTSGPTPISTTTVKPNTTFTTTTTTLPTMTTTASTTATTTTLPTTTTTASTSTSIYTTTLEPKCTKEGEKKLFQKGDCKDYLECDSGKWVKKSCAFGYDFDVNNLQCIWSWWAKC